MNKENRMSDAVTFPELVAVLVKNIYKVIACTLVFAVLLGAYGILWYYVLAENPDEEYEVALADYETTKQNLEASIERTSMDLAHQREYIEDSLLMQINPYNKVSTTLAIAISGIDDSDVNDSFAAYETPISYMTTRIMNQYSILWNQMSLQEIVKGTTLEGSEEKYLREVISFEVADGGVMNIRVDGQTVAECEKTINAIVDVFKTNKQMVESGSYRHAFTMLSQPVTKTSIDLELEKLQLDNNELLETYEKNIVDYRKSLLELEAPSNDAGWRGIIVKAIIGGVIGCVLGCVWFVFFHMTDSKVTGAAHVTDRFDLEHLGTLGNPKGKIDRLVNRLQKEKVWSDRKMALEYLEENGGLTLADAKNLVLVSDVADMEESTVAELVNALRSNGRNVSFVTDLQMQATSLAAVRQADAVVLVERPFVSKTKDMQANIATVKKIGKPICGFVLA